MILTKSQSFSPGIIQNLTPHPPQQVGKDTVHINQE